MEKRRLRSSPNIFMAIAALGAREHGVDAVADGLTYLDIRTLDGGELMANIVEQLAVAAARELKRSLYLRHIHPKACSSSSARPDLAGNRLDLRN